MFLKISSNCGKVTIVLETESGQTRCEKSRDMVQRALSLSWQISPQVPSYGGIEDSFGKHHRLLTFPCVEQMSKCFFLAIGTPVGIPSASVSVALSSGSQQFCINRFALSLALKQRLGATREWPIKYMLRQNTLREYLGSPVFSGTAHF